MEVTYSYDQRYTPWNPPSYQRHAPQYNAHQSNGFGDAYYGYEDPPSRYPTSQGNIKGILQVLLQERREIREAQKGIEAQLAILIELVTRLDVENLNHKEVHECLEEVEEENIDQEVAVEDKESKGMQIIQSASSEATPPESPSKLHFEWVNPSAMNFLGPQHYGLLETDGQLRALCGVLDKKKLDSLGLDKSRKSYKNQHVWGVIACIGAFRDLLNMNWDPIENTKFKHWWGFKDEFKHKPP
ncbi:hypothetical protein PIB30_056258 [Stylosanthes scabra]|uniref:BAG domain-containing protein n=1 Tax=Stylosanthes scabra TaxID=79078 RepID=A0ABU6ZI05_9FABA|nr:hypothetical protein [Stylosanthes scabra]